LLSASKRATQLGLVSRKVKVNFGNVIARFPDVPLLA
jgi:hypothetical protein